MQRVSFPIACLMISMAVGVVGVGCSSSSADGGAADASSGPPDGGGADSLAADGALDTASAYDAASIIAARPYKLHVPTGVTPTTLAPLLVMFHGFSVTGAVEESYMRIAPVAEAHGFLYAYGDGTSDKDGNPFWNATDGCCNLYGSPVDDVAYFDAIVDDVSAKYNVDKKRIYVLGHSNGGFMAHRLACERSSRIAGIAALAGDNYLDPTKCKPSEHVAILQVHGDADQTILYPGGSTSQGPYPSAHASVASWAQKNGCTGALGGTATLDLDANLAGNETKAETYAGCPAGVDVALWTIQGGMHAPAFLRPAWGENVWTFLSAHQKP